MFCAKHLTLAIVLYCNSQSNFYITSWTLQSSKLNMKTYFSRGENYRGCRRKAAISTIRPFKQNNRTFTFLDRNTDEKKQDCIMLCLFRK